MYLVLHTSNYTSLMSGLGTRLITPQLKRIDQGSQIVSCRELQVQHELPVHALTTELQQLLIQDAFKSLG